MHGLKKSLFFRIMTMTVTTMLVCLLLIGTITFNSLGRYVINEKLELLEANISKVSQMTTMLVENPGDLRYESFYQISLDSIANSTSSSIIIVNTNYEIFYQSNVDAISLDTDELINNSFITQIFGGSKKSFVSLGTLDNLFDRATLTVGYPILYGSQTIGAALMSVPSPRLQSMKSDIMFIFLIAASIAAVLTFFMSYFFSRHLARPLNAMNTAAKKMTQGDFSQRVSVDVADKVSEVSTLIETFNSMAESVENTEEARRSFIASVSHELRTPMTTIIGFVEGIMDGTIPAEKQNQYMEIILSETKRLSRLVTELLDVSRIENQTFTLNLSKFDINECIRQQLLRFETRATQKQLSVSVEFLHESCWCMCDRDAITRVIINLLDNAVKYASAGGEIYISVTESAKKAVISIKNSGEGISPEDLKHIFDKFYKVDKSRGLDKKGVGLGLYLVKNIIGQHGESIKAESEAGVSTTFTFTLPLA